MRRSTVQMSVHSPSLGMDEKREHWVDAPGKEVDSYKNVPKQIQIFTLYCPARQTSPRSVSWVSEVPDGKKWFKALRQQRLKAPPTSATPSTLLRQLFDRQRYRPWLRRIERSPLMIPQLRDSRTRPILQRGKRTMKNDPLRMKVKESCGIFAVSALPADRPPQRHPVFLNFVRKVEIIFYIMK